MNDKNVTCYILPSLPLPALIPVECVADVVERPTIEWLESAQAKWMKGHAGWQSQRLPVMSFTALLNNELDKKLIAENTHLIVLNAVPDASIKSYTSLLCYGEIKKVQIDDTVDYVEIEEEIDDRYIEGVVRFDGQDYIVPKLSAIAVAFTYI